MRRLASPAEKLWRAIAAFGEGTFTLRDLHARVKAERSIDSVRQAVRALVAEGKVEHVGAAVGHWGGRPSSLPPPKLFRCSRPAAPFVPAAPAAEDETRQQKMWRAMRNLREWGVAELAAAAGTEEVPVDAPCAQAYVSTLVKVGYVQVVRPRTSDFGVGSVPATYRLAPAANTGPLAPEVRRGRKVYDANRRSLVHGGEVAP